VLGFKHVLSFSDTSHGRITSKTGLPSQVLSLAAVSLLMVDDHSGLTGGKVNASSLGIPSIWNTADTQ